MHACEKIIEACFANDLINIRKVGYDFIGRDSSKFRICSILR